MGNQFRKGDRVRVVKLWLSNGYKVGDTGVVSAIVGSDYTDGPIGALVTWDKGCGPGYKGESFLSIRAGEIELAPVEPQRTFKVGDRVRFIRSGQLYEPQPFGKLATVAGYDGNGHLKLDFDGCIRPPGWTCREEHIELFDPIADALARGKFKFKHATHDTLYSASRYGDQWMVTWAGGSVTYAYNEPGKFLRDGYWQLVDDGAVIPAKSKADELVEALTAAKARTKAASARYNELCSQCNDASNELQDAHDAELAAQRALYDAA